MSNDQPTLFPLPGPPPFPPPWDKRLLFSALALIGHGNYAGCKAFDYVWQQGTLGATCDEVEVGTGMAHQTCSARFNELKGSKYGLLKATGKRRKTRNGGDAEVYVVDTLAIEARATGRNLLL